VQGDVFDHLLAILPEMGLRLYQAPSGADMSGLRMSAVLANAQSAGAVAPLGAPALAGNPSAGQAAA
jgi:miniconductance mechanosensitive channel